MPQDIFECSPRIYRDDPTATEFQVLDRDHTPSWKRWGAKGAFGVTFRVADRNNGVIVNIEASETCYANEHTGPAKDVTKAVDITLGADAAYSLYQALKKAHGDV